MKPKKTKDNKKTKDKIEIKWTIGVPEEIWEFVEQYPLVAIIALALIAYLVGKFIGGFR